MSLRVRAVLIIAALSLWFSVAGFCSAYNARPKLIVIIVIDQFRADYLERYRDQFGVGGFRLFLDHGADFIECNYNYANTRTAPGHATLLTGTYSNGHGILDNQWWDQRKKRMVTSVEDDSTQLVGVSPPARGTSPRNLQADTLGDELKLSTEGKSRVFAIALKDRAAVLAGGFSADAAYWTEKNGTWVTSTYYRSELPKWAQDFNSEKRMDKYLNREWKDDNGKLLRSMPPTAGRQADFYESIGSTPFANDYELEFARDLITDERLGTGPATDLFILGLSANDLLGHQVGPDSPEMQAMVLATDRQLASFFDFLGQRLGLANLWMALSADHGIAPLPRVAAQLRIPAANLSAAKMRADLNLAISARISSGHPAEYVKSFDFPIAWLNEDAFAALKMKEEDAERATGEALKQVGLSGYYTRSQLAHGDVPPTEIGLKYAKSYSPLGGWYVMGIPVPFTIGSTSGTDHASPYTYDTHVPLSFYGLPFQPGTYRTHAEPVDLVTTFSSLLGINAPTHAVGRVLIEALTPTQRLETVPRAPGVRVPRTPQGEQSTPVAMNGHTSGEAR
jgi:predicted AlkP superfamily pyrophosphatase or phosphodiesterase